MAEDKMAAASWKDQMTERWKPKSPHIQLTIEILVIPRPIT